jgi:hypothetical protein
VRETLSHYDNDLIHKNQFDLKQKICVAIPSQYLVHKFQSLDMNNDNPVVYLPLIPFRIKRIIITNKTTRRMEYADD